MTKEQALQYAKYAAKKHLTNWKSNVLSVIFVMFYIIVIAAEVNLEIAKSQLVE